MDTFTYIPRVARITLDKDSCIGCRACTMVCPHQLFTVKDQKAALINRDNCMECGACSLNCPVDAISVTPGVGCAALIVGRWLARVGISSKGCC